MTTSRACASVVSHYLTRHRTGENNESIAPSNDTERQKHFPQRSFFLLSEVEAAPGFVDALNKPAPFGVLFAFEAFNLFLVAGRWLPGFSVMHYYTTFCIA